MKSRFALTASVLALGLAVGLQPLSLDPLSLKLGSSYAQAKGGDGGGNGGNGGGNGGGDHGGGNGGGPGGNGAGGGGHGGGGGNNGGHGGHGGNGGNGGGPGGNGRGHDHAGSVRDGTRSSRGAEGTHGATSGQTLGLIEGFLNDLRQDHRTGHSQTRSKGTGKSASHAHADTTTGAKSRHNSASDSRTRSSTQKTSGASLGRLNAAHASEQALLNASPNSAVGRIAAYRAALEDDRLEDAAASLASVSNKPVTAETVRSLNGLLGITLDDQKIAKVVEQTEDLRTRQQTSVTSTAPSPTSPTTATSSSLGRLNAAHASARALDRANSRSAVGQIASYKSAVEANDLDAAAAALAAGSNKPLSDTAVRNLNDLLGITLTDAKVDQLVEKAEALKADQKAGLAPAEDPTR